MRLGLPLRRDVGAILGLALVAIAAAFGSPRDARAGVDAWTTTGPRATWTFIYADARAGNTMFVADRDRWARSGDGGASWTSFLPDASPGLHDVRAVCADLQVPGRFFSSIREYRIRRSDDYGLTWTDMPALIPGSPAPLLSPVRAIDCDGSRLLVAVAGPIAGLFKSDDGAVSPFQRIDIPSGPGEVAFARAGDRLVVVYVNGRVARTSADRGVTWAPGAFELPEGYAFRSVAWAGGSRFVALVRAPGGQTKHAIWISDDHGATYSERPATAFDQANPVLHADPVERNRLSTAGAGALRVSTNGGETWTSVTGLPSDEWRPVVAWGPPGAPGESALLVASLTRGLQSSNDAGMSFVARNGNLPGAAVENVDYSIYQGDRIELAAVVPGDAAETLPSSKLQRRDALSNRWTPGTGGGAFVSAREAPGLVFRIFDQRSFDGGATWTPVEVSDLSWIYTVARRTYVPDSLVAWSSSYFLASSTGVLDIRCDVRLGDPSGIVWTSLEGPWHCQDLGANVYGVAVAPSDPEVVYVAAQSPSSGSPFQGARHLYRSSDRGVTWTEFAFPPEAAGTHIEVSSTDPNHLWLTIAGTANLLESLNGGATWTILQGPESSVSANFVTFDGGVSPARLYIGTDDGLFVRIGSATLWERVGASQGTSVRRIQIDGSSDRRTILASTDRGVWEFTTDSAAATLPVYRFYNTRTRTHFYTASEAERAHVLATWPHFVPEGIAFHAVKAERGTIGQPVWRFFNTQTGTHFYTASAAERAHVLSTWPQFVEEGEVYRALAGTEAGTVKLFRFFNTQTGAHFYTTEDDERDFVNGRLPMFIDEGATYSVYPASPVQ